MTNASKRKLTRTDQAYVDWMKEQARTSPAFVDRLLEKLIEQEMNEMRKTGELSPDHAA